MSFPSGDFSDQLLLAGDAPIQTLTTQNADFDLDHVQPACMFGNIVELEPSQHASRLVGGKGLVERTGGMGRQIVEDDPDALCLGVMDIGEIAHAGGEVDGGAVVSDFDPAPGAMHVLSLIHI